MNKKVAIIGNGWVGKGLQDLFPEALVYTRAGATMGNSVDDSGKVIGNYFTNDKQKVNECDVAFICVPTPNYKDHTGSDKNLNNLYGEGKLDTSAVEECIAWCEATLIVIRSTVNPGDCDYWSEKYGKHIVFQPEYLGETPAHPLLDTKQTNFMILGGGKLWTRVLIELYATVYNANMKIRQVSLRTAEIIKLSENRAIAFKVAQCQELYDVCQLDGTDYYEIVQAVYGDDPRFNLWWTFVYPEERGFKSKCIPKDIYAWCAWAESLGYEPKITRGILEKNKQWIEGR